MKACNDTIFPDEINNPTNHFHSRAGTIYNQIHLQVTQRRFARGHAKEVATGGVGTGGHAEEGLLRPGFAEAEDGLKRQRRVCRGRGGFAEVTHRLTEAPKFVSTLK